MHNTLIVEKGDVGVRLDKFLVGKLKGLSRTQVQRAIEEGVWQVDGTQVTPHYALKEGQKVEKVKTGNEIQEVKEILRQAQDDKLRVQDIKVIAEDEHYLVIDKPSGIAVHPADGVKEPTLVELLLSRYPELEGVGEDPARPGVAHRLDKAVSGVMVLARTQDAWRWLKKAFQERAVEKEYTALVHGTFVNDAGEIDAPLIRSRQKRKRGIMKVLPRGSSQEANAREAQTVYEVRERFPRATLLAVFPKTGRTHQIRAHFASLGHPIVGDTLYRGKRSREWKLSPLGRPFLHAHAISFFDLKGEKRTYRAALPAELEEVISKLRS